MSVDTKGFVLTDNKDVFKIAAAVERALIELAERETGGVNYFETYAGKTRWRPPQIEVRPGLGFLDFTFTHNTENRSMLVHFECDNDYEYIKPGKRIIVSLGAWGHSVPLVRCAVKAIAEVTGGEGWMTEDDCSEQWYEVTE